MATDKGLDVVILPAEFYGFTNTTFNRMYINHQHNGQQQPNQKWIPAEIEVNDDELRKFLKKISRGTRLQITISRKTNHLGTTAELISATKLKAKKPRK